MSQVSKNLRSWSLETTWKKISQYQILPQPPSQLVLLLLLQFVVVTGTRRRQVHVANFLPMAETGPDWSDLVTCRCPAPGAQLSRFLLFILHLPITIKCFGSKYYSLISNNLRSTLEKKYIQKYFLFLRCRSQVSRSQTIYPREKFHKLLISTLEKNIFIQEYFSFFMLQVSNNLRSTLEKNTFIQEYFSFFCAPGLQQSKIYTWKKFTKREKLYYIFVFLCSRSPGLQVSRSPGLQLSSSPALQLSRSPTI